MAGAPHMKDGFKPDKNRYHDHEVDARTALLSEDVAEGGAQDFYESVISDVNDDDEDEDEDVKWLREERLNLRLIHWYKRPSIYMMCVFLLLFSITSQLSIPEEFNLIMKSVCKNLGDKCDPQTVQSKTATLMNMAEVPSSILRIMVAGKLGQLSDIHGRRPVIIFTVLTTLAGKSLVAYSIYPGHAVFSPILFVCGQLIVSLGGSLFTALSLANSYVTDVVEENMRSSAMSITVACFYVGFGMGPTIGSFLFVGLMKRTDFEVVLLANSLLFLTLIISYFLLTESRSLRLRRKSRTFSESSRELRDQARAVIVGRGEYYKFKLREMLGVFAPLKLLWITRYNSDGSLDKVGRSNVLKLVFIDFIISASSMGLSVIFVLYTTFRFHWTSQTLGYFISVVMFGRGFTLFVCTPWLQHLLRKHFKHLEKHFDKIDFYCILISVIFETVGLCLISLAYNTASFFTGAFIASFGATSTPAIHSAIAKHGKMENIGELFGALTLNRNGVLLVIPVTLQYIYSKTVSFCPQFVFYIASCCVSLSLIICFLLHVKGEEDGLDDVSFTCPDTESNIGRPTSQTTLNRKKSAAGIARMESLNGTGFTDAEPTNSSYSSGS